MRFFQSSHKADRVFEIRQIFRDYHSKGIGNQGNNVKIRKTWTARQCNSIHCISLSGISEPRTPPISQSFNPMKHLLVILLISFEFHIDLAQANPVEYKGSKVRSETASAKEILQISQDLVGAQRQFDTIWAAVLKKFFKQKKFLEELRSEHESWLHFRDEMSHTMGLMGVYADFSPKGSSEFMRRKAVYTRDRSKWLRGLLLQPGTDSDLSGVWWSSMGDAIRIDQTKDEIGFSYSAAGGNGHQGIAAGSIKWNAGNGTFSAVWNESANGKNGTIVFKLENGLLRTRQDGVVSETAGIGVTFSNKFTRVAPLADKDREHIAYDIKSFGPPKVH
jgi:hypothetical protein